MLWKAGGAGGTNMLAANADHNNSQSLWRNSLGPITDKHIPVQFLFSGRQSQKEREWWKGYSGFEGGDLENAN